VSAPDGHTVVHAPHPDAQVRLDGDAIAVGRIGERGAHVDALVAALDARARCARTAIPCSGRTRLLELADVVRELGHRFRLRDRIGAGPEITLRRLVLP
jgi:hypothetical protein